MIAREESSLALPPVFPKLFTLRRGGLSNGDPWFTSCPNWMRARPSPSILLQDQGIEHQFGAARNAKLIEDAKEVILYCVLAQPELA